MPRYFFDVHDGVEHPDATGRNLRDLDAAKTEAVVLAGILLVENPVQVWNGEDWSIDVKDESRAVRFTLQFKALVAEDRP